MITQLGPQFNDSLINIRECNENDVCIQLQANVSILVIIVNYALDHFYAAV